MKDDLYKLNGFFNRVAQREYQQAIAETNPSRRKRPGKLVRDLLAIKRVKDGFRELGMLLDDGDTD